MPLYAPALRWFARQAITDPVITQIDVPATFALPATFSMGAYEGLLAVEIVRSADASRLLALWRDRTARDLRQTHLADALGGTIAWSGDVLAVQKPKSWRPSSLSDALLKGSAMIGAITVFWTLLSSVFAAPNVVFAVAELQPVDAGLGERFAFTVAAINNDRSNAARVALSIRNPQRAGISLNTPLLVVPPGGREVASISGIASQPGTTSVELDASTTSGDWMPAADRVITTSVRVWPAVEVSPLARQQRAGVSQYTMMFQGHVATGDGAVKALQCEAVVVNAPASLQFASASPTLEGSGTALESRGTHARTIAYRWGVPIPRRFVPVRVSVYLENDAPISNLGGQNIQPTLNCQEVR